MAPARRPLIWDVPTRAVHWALALLVPFSWWSATHRHLPWHRLSGYTILGLLAFRIAWGIWGPETARFSRFLAGPRRLRDYLGGRFGAFVGHNPLGGWSVVAMLAALCLQVGLGLFSIDIDSLQPGPLARFLTFDDARAVAHIHHLVFWFVVGLIVLHLAAIAFYAARGRNLTAPMLTGRGEIPEGVAPPKTSPLLRALVIALIAFALAWFVGHGLRWTAPPPSPISGLDS